MELQIVGGELRTVDPAEILYVESQGKYKLLVLRSETLTLRCSMEELEERLGGALLRCHRSYYVNCRAVRQVDGAELILTDGSRVPVSRYRRGVRAAARRCGA